MESARHGRLARSPPAAFCEASAADSANQSDGGWRMTASSSEGSKSGRPGKVECPDSVLVTSASNRCWASPDDGKTTPPSCSEARRKTLRSRSQSMREDNAMPIGSPPRPIAAAARTGHRLEDMKLLRTSTSYNFHIPKWMADPAFEKFHNMGPCCFCYERVLAMWPQTLPMPKYQYQSLMHCSSCRPSHFERSCSSLV